MSDSTNSVTQRIDPVEELLKANVIVGAMSPRAAQRLRELVTKLRKACDA